jgi:hypothetical protein
MRTIMIAAVAFVGLAILPTIASAQDPAAGAGAGRRDCVETQR